MMASLYQSGSDSSASVIRVAPAGARALRADADVLVKVVLKFTTSDSVRAEWLCGAEHRTDGSHTGIEILLRLDSPSQTEDGGAECDRFGQLPRGRSKHAITCLIVCSLSRRLE